MDTDYQNKSGIKMLHVNKSAGRSRSDVALFGKKSHFKSMGWLILDVFMLGIHAHTVILIMSFRLG